MCQFEWDILYKFEVEYLVSSWWWFGEDQARYTPGLPNIVPTPTSSLPNSSIIQRLRGSPISALVRCTKWLTTDGYSEHFKHVLYTVQRWILQSKVPINLFLGLPGLDTGQGHTPLQTLYSSIIWFPRFCSHSSEDTGSHTVIWIATRNVSLLGQTGLIRCFI